MTSTRFPRTAAALTACAALVAGLAATIPASCADDSAPPAKASDIPADTEIVTTASGLKYSVLVAGKEGKHPKMGETVKVHYTGWLTDGTKFDSSRDRGAPTEFMVGQVIPGWNEALQLMTTGARWKLTIPPKLAYGESGSPPKIPGNSTLVFDVELIDFRSMPEFTAPNAAAQKTTASGLKYEVLTEGKGDAPAADDAVELKFAFWNQKGGLCDATEKSGQTVKARAEDLSLAFLKEAIPLLRPGCKYRFEVPAALCFGEKAMGPELPANSVTIWDVELVRVIHPLPLPKFALPDEAKAKTTASGLKYEVIAEGEGVSPKMGEKVKVHYAGWLTDGSLFDSSYARGEPMDFPIGRVIQGWNETLQMMKPGAIYRITVPPSLGYGARQMGPKIPPNSTLIFYVNYVGPAAAE